MIYRSGSMCVGVTVWFGWVGVVLQAEALLHKLRHQIEHKTKSTTPRDSKNKKWANIRIHIRTDTH